jgi:hypothetical protein
MREAGFAIDYGSVDEPWGVRRFYVRDPFGDDSEIADLHLTRAYDAHNPRSR